jgi:hypothetical protein
MIVRIAAITATESCVRRPLLLRYNMMRHHNGSHSIWHERGEELSFTLSQRLNWHSREVATFWGHTK